MKRILAALFAIAVVAMGVPALGQSTATPVVTGYLTTIGCPYGATSCFVQYGSGGTSGGFVPLAPGVSLTASSTSSNAAITAGGTVLEVTNLGANTVNAKLGTTNAVTAAATDLPIPAGATVPMAIGANTYLAVYAATGSNSVLATSGTGGAYAVGGGGGSSGNACAGTVTSTAPTSACLSGLIDGSGNLQGVSSTNPEPVTLSGVTVPVSIANGQNVVEGSAANTTGNCTSGSITIQGCLIQLDVDIKSGSGATGSAVPSSGIYIAGNKGGNLTGFTLTSAGFLQVDESSLDGIALGAPSNYGTSPGAVEVGGVNAFVTSVPGAGATGSAPPASASYQSVSEGGNLTGVVGCNLHAFIHVTSGTDTLLVQGVASQTVKVCGVKASFAGTAAQAVYLENTASANANCSSTKVQIAGAMTGNASAPNVDGFISATWTGLANTSGNGLCLNSTGTGPVDVDLWYTQGS